MTFLTLFKYRHEIKRLFVCNKWIESQYSFSHKSSIDFKRGNYTISPADDSISTLHLSQEVFN